MAAGRVQPSVSGMSTRHPTLRVEVSFTGAPPVPRIERASGVSDVEVDGRTVRCLVAGSVQPFLEALWGHEVLSLSSVPAIDEMSTHKGDLR
jgi:hypothetical protein